VVEPVSSEGGEVGKKRDIKALLSVVPPAEALKKQRGQGVRERRIKLRYGEAVKQGTLHINPALAKELSITDYAEVSVHGRRVRLKVVLDEGVPPSEVWGSSDLRNYGIADNSIVTLRASS
jgi:hypothetical protein